jgi:hypothetical protein
MPHSGLCTPSQRKQADDLRIRLPYPCTRELAGELIAAAAPIAADAPARKARVHAIVQRCRSVGTGPIFLPRDGLCYSCGQDVTNALMDRPDTSLDIGITGCPLCLRSWCS